MSRQTSLRKYFFDAGAEPLAARKVLVPGRNISRFMFFSDHFSNALNFEQLSHSTKLADWDLILP
jgi:hypothetical protein